jgi:hypothetical protein
MASGGSRICENYVRIEMPMFVLRLLLSAVCGCGPLNPLFAGSSYKGKVIDSETKETLSGAVVLI